MPRINSATNDMDPLGRRCAHSNSLLETRSDDNNGAGDGAAKICSNIACYSSTARITDLRSRVQEYEKGIASAEGTHDNEEPQAAVVDFAEVHMNVKSRVPEILVGSHEVSIGLNPPVVTVPVNGQSLPEGAAQYHQARHTGTFLKPPHKQHKSRSSVSSNGTSQRTVSDGPLRSDDICELLTLYLTHDDHPKRGMKPDALIDTGNEAPASLISDEIAEQLGWVRGKRKLRCKVFQLDGKSIRVLGKIKLRTQFMAPGCKGFLTRKIQFWVVSGKCMDRDCILNTKLATRYRGILDHATRRIRDHSDCRARRFRGLNGGRP